MADRRRDPSFTKRILADQAERAKRMERMMGVIGDEMSALGASSVDFGNGVVLQLGEKAITAGESIHVSTYVLTVAAPYVGTDGPDPWKAWRNLPVESRIELDVLRQRAPSARLVDDASQFLPWLRDTVIITEDAEEFERLTEDPASLLAERHRPYVSIRKLPPIEPKLVEDYREMKRKIKRLERELNAMRGQAVAASNLKQAGRFLVLAAATGAAEAFGLTPDILAKVDGWANAEHEHNKKKRLLSRALSKAKSHEYDFPYGDLIHRCELDREG